MPGSSCRSDSHSSCAQIHHEAQIRITAGGVNAPRHDAPSTTDLRLFECGDTATELELHLALHTVVVALRVTHQQELHEAPD